MRNCGFKYISEWVGIRMTDLIYHFNLASGDDGPRHAPRIPRDSPGPCFKFKSVVLNNYFMTSNIIGL